MRRTPAILLLPLVASCAANGLNAAFSPAPTDGAVARVVDLRIDVIPANMRDANNRYRALPQSILSSKIETHLPLDLGEVRLLEPIEQTGQLAGYRVNPFVSTLPGTEVPLAGLVQLRRADTLQRYSANTDELGEFSAWALPGSYRLEIVPFDPLLPFSTSDWTITDPPTPIALDLGAGVPVYGEIVSEVGPVEGIPVHLEDEFGTTSSSAKTDENGRYQIRATEGRWTLVSEGLPNSRVPTLRFPDLEVGPAGYHLDVFYPSDLAPASLEGVIEGPGGEGLEQAKIRIVADSLLGYEGEQASWVYEVVSGEQGGFFCPIVPGTFTMEIMPPEDAPLTPARFTELQVESDWTALAPIRLGELRLISGTVEGPNGAGLEGAPVDCSEVGFGGRTWREFTGQGGEFEFEVSDVTLECRVDPPANRNDLASQWLILESTQNGGINTGIQMELPVGQRISGKVTAGGEPEAYVVINILDLTGRSLGSGITLQDGDFSVVVDLQSAQEAAEPAQP